MDYDFLINKYLDYHRAMFHTEKTVINYQEVLHEFVKFLRFNRCDVLCRNVFVDYNLYLSKKGLKSASVASYLRHIKAFVHWLGDNGYIDDKELYKAIRLPKQAKRNVKIYTDDEIAQIYSSVSSSVPWITARNCLLISLMYDSGLRQNELCKISVSDLDIDNQILHVHGKGNKDRIVPIGRITLNYLEDYLYLVPSLRDTLLVSRAGDLTPNTVRQMMYKLKTKLGFEFSSHKLRHNFATNYLVDCYLKFGYFDTYSLMVLLGHEDISTTDRYVHLAKQFIASRNIVSHLDSVFLPGENVTK